jgi:hypothetical protein
VAWLNFAQERESGLTCMNAVIWEGDFLVLAVTLPHGISSV